MNALRVPLAARPVLADVTAAHGYIVSNALTESSVGPVGLELEFHLVDLHSPMRRATWAEISSLTASLPPMPAASAVTVEPGGQLELSTVPKPDVGSAIAALQRDRTTLAEALSGAGFGLASVGADPARPVRRVSPASRYAAMEQHFDAVGCGGPGRAMMSATAALQVNLDAGPAGSWAARLRHIHRLGPVLVALSTCSPLLAGRASGWRSMRQQVWTGIDQARCGPLRCGADPAAEWAAYALSAPVMLLRDPATGDTRPVTDRVSFAAWVSGDVSLGRAPTTDDLDYHLSTLFPPVRPRGFLEIRCLDAVPTRWWPALAALTVTLIDDEVAADAAAEVCEPMAGRWLEAARAGLGSRAIARAARRCAAIAASRCPVELRPGVEAFAEMVSAGRVPGDDLRERAASEGPLAVLEEEARA